jgi:hypothetical protein
MANSPTTIWNVAVELYTIGTTLLEDICRMAEYTAVAERLASLPDAVDVPESGLEFRFGSRLWDHPEFLRDDLVDNEVRERFAAYSARYAVLAMIAAFEVFTLRLLWIALACKWMSEHGKEIAVADFYRLGNKAREEARHAGPLELVRKVCQLLGIGTEFESFPAVSSIYQARNCLAHRGGVVGPEDMQNGQLTLAFHVVRFMIDGVPRDSIRGMRVEAGSMIGARIDIARRRLSADDNLILSPQDCQGIALTIASFANELLDAMSAAVRRILDAQNALV